MGNALRASRRRTTKIMKIDGEVTKHKTPVRAMEITKTHPGHVLLDSEAVKKYGIRAKPLDLGEYLEPKRVYFLVELPKLPVDPARVPRRVRSGGIHMGARERLEGLMLSKRSVSDMSAMKELPLPQPPVEEAVPGVRVRMRLPRAEVERLVSKSKDRADAARRIMDLCDIMQNPSSSGDGLEVVKEKTSPFGEGFQKKRVGFLPVAQQQVQYSKLAA